MNEQVLKVDEVDNSHTAGNAKNGLLSRLDTVSRVALAPHLELVPFSNGDMIARAGDEADSICFPLTGIAAVLDSLEGDRRY